MKQGHGEALGGGVLIVGQGNFPEGASSEPRPSGRKGGAQGPGGGGSILGRVNSSLVIARFIFHFANQFLMGCVFSENNLFKSFKFICIKFHIVFYYD